MRSRNGTIYKALLDASNPNIGTLDTIAEAKEALELFWWLQYCDEETKK